MFFGPYGEEDKQCALMNSAIVDPSEVGEHDPKEDEGKTCSRKTVPFIVMPGSCDGSSPEGMLQAKKKAEEAALNKQYPMSGAKVDQQEQGAVTPGTTPTASSGADKDDVTAKMLREAAAKAAAALAKSRIVVDKHEALTKPIQEEKVGPKVQPVTAAPVISR